MVESLGWAELEVRPTFSHSFDSDLNRGVSSHMASAGTIGGRKYGDAAGRSMASAFSHHAKTAALAAGAGFAIAGAALFKIGGDSLAEAREAQKVGAITTQVIKSTGGAANVTAAQVGDLTSKLSAKVGIDDEVIQRGANMLLTFKNIHDEVGKGNAIFDQSVAITTDMAAAMAGGMGGEIDLKAASIQVGKALNDPIKGITALSKVGVSFTDQQKLQIKALVDSGKTMDAQKIILRELKSEFGGTAAAQATLADKTKVAWGNIEEQLGGVLLPLVDKAERAFLKKGVPAITGWVDTFEKKGVPALKHFYDRAKPLVAETLPALGDTLGTVRDVLADAAPYAKDLIGYFNDMPDWAKKAIVEGGIGAFGASKLGLIGGKGGALGGGGLLGGITKGAPLPVYVVNNGVGGGVGGTGGIPTGGTPGAFGTKVPPLGSLPAFVPPLGIGGVRPMPKALDTPSDAQDLMNGISREQLDRTAKMFASLPRKLQTEVVLKGAPESRKEAMALVRQYDLTPKEKRTLFKVLDITDNQRTVGKYQHVLGSTPKKVSTDVSVFGVASASQQVSTLLAQLHALTDHGWNFSALGNVPGGGSSGGGSSSGGSSGKSSTGGKSGRPPVQVNIHVGGEKVGSVVTDQISADRDLHERAARANR